MAELVADPELLSRLHRILRQHQDLMGRVRRCPLKVNAARKLEEDAVKVLEDLRSAAKATRLAADQKQLQLNEREARVQNLIVKRNGCETNREYQLLSDQIAADEQANSIQGDEIFELLERVDSIKAKIAEEGILVEKAKEATLRAQAAADEEMSLLQQDLKEVRKELIEAEKSLAPDIRDRFRRMVESMGENALAPVDDGCCGNCHTVLIAQSQSDLILKKAVFCRSCGSLLYRPSGP